MAMNLIASTRLSSTNAQILFSNIPQTYDHLYLVISARTTSGNSGDFAAIRPNGDNDTNCSGIYYYSNNASPTFETRAGCFMRVASNIATANVFSTGEVYIVDYTATNKPKIMFGQSAVTTVNGVTNNWMYNGTMFKKDNAAITSLYVNSVGGSYVAKSMVSLYGIK